MIQILLGVLRVGSLVAYTPYSVVSGFTSGVAIIIIAMQVLPFMGAALETGIGAGLGNTVAGLFGGLPGAGAPTATEANIRRGARTQASGATGAIVLVVLAVVLGRYTDEIPLAVLAGILLWIGFGLIDWRFITHLHKVQPEHALVMALTLVLTVFFDLIGTVAVGLIAAGLAGSRQFERLQLDSVISVPILDQVFFGLDTDDPEEMDQYSARVGLVALRGSFTVASSNKLRMTVSADIVQHEVVILDFSDTAYMDDSAALLVEQLIDSALANDTECIVMGLRGLPATSLQSLDALRRVPGDHFVESLDDARAIAKRLLDR